MATITPSIPTGSVTIFRQVTAPVKWTKNLTYNDYALRVTSGTAGVSGPTNTVPFSTLNATTVSIGGTYTITGASVSPAPGGTGVPSHTHQMGPSPNLGPFNIFYNSQGSDGGAGSGPAGTAGYSYYTGYTGVASGAAGGGAAHSHTASSPYSSFPFGPFGITSDFTFSVKYLDVILCTRTG